MTNDSADLDWTHVSDPHAPASHHLDDATPVLGTSTIAVPLADVHRDPDTTSELVTQALLGTPAARLAVSADGGWTCVRLPDYQGWVQTPALGPEADPPVHAAPNDYVRVVASRAVLQLEAEQWTVFAGSLLRRSGAEDETQLGVQLSDGRKGWIASAAVRPLLEHAGTKGDVAGVLATAHEYLTTPYLWGGMTVHGIDCSGFVQTVYRVHGYTIPRDADEQYAALPAEVERGAWQPGDLLFYGSPPDGKPAAQWITHVGLYLGDGRVIHASGRQDPASVVIQSTDPQAADYAPRLVHTYIGARRIITQEK